MSNILNFTPRKERSWSMVERELRTELRKYDVPPAVEDRLATTMKDFWELIDLGPVNFPLRIELPGSMSDDETSAVYSSILEQVTAEVGPILQDKHRALFYERLNREIDICRELGLIPPLG